MGLNDGITNSAQKVVFHTLRHTFCSWLAIRGVPLYTIGKLAGHTTPDMARRYAKLSPDAKREAIQQISSFLHPDCITSPKTIIAVHCDPDLYRWCRGDPTPSQQPFATSCVFARRLRPSAPFSNPEGGFAARPFASLTGQRRGCA